MMCGTSFIFAPFVGRVVEDGRLLSHGFWGRTHGILDLVLLALGVGLRLLGGQALGAQQETDGGEDCDEAESFHDAPP
jgi:hypothetical protein